MNHTDYLLQALALAELRRGFCAPNPAVGALIVKDNQIIASGSHQAAGAPHAEAVALQQLGLGAAAGATLYVTLEPCCHYGRTPPCIDLLIQSQIKQVFYGYADPNPQVAGKGALQLQQAGINCEQIQLPAIDMFYQSYSYWWQHKTPWVTAKLAISLDSKIAAADGSPVAITGPALQRLTHQWRQRSDAILTTAATVMADNPRLDVRLEGNSYKKPIYVLDSQLRTPLNSALFNTAAQLTFFYRADTAPTTLSALQDKGAHCVAIAWDEQQQGLDLSVIMRLLGTVGIHDLWVEAGGICFSALLAAKQMQRALIYIAPKLLGHAAKPAFPGQIDYFATAHQINWQTIGDEAIVELLF